MSNGKEFAGILTAAESGGAGVAGGAGAAGTNGLSGNPSRAIYDGHLILLSPLPLEYSPP